LNKAEVMEQLQPLVGTVVRQVQHSPRTKVIVTPEMVTLRPGSGGALVPINKPGVKAMANFIGMPAGMAKQLSPDTFGKVATELLSRKERYNLLMQEDENGPAIGDFSVFRGTGGIKAERVVDTIERSIPNAEFHRVNLFNDHSASIEVVGEQRQPVARGDLIRGGTMVTFSPVNTIAPSVRSFAVRCLCTNGMTSNDTIREYAFNGGGGGGGGQGDDIWQWFRQSMRASYQALNAIVTRYQQLKDERIPQNERAAMLEALLREAKISGEDADAVRAQAIENPPRNAYDVLNLITWASSHVIREPERIRRAQLAAADFTSKDTHARSCPLCHHRN